MHRWRALGEVDEPCRGVVKLVEIVIQSRGVARGDIAGGLTAAIVMLAIEGSYGLVAYSRLGPEHRAARLRAGGCSAAIASVTMFAMGGRGPLLSGPSAALALLVPALMGALVIDPRFLSADGRPAIPLLLAFVAFGTVLAGMMQVLLAWLRLGGLVRYVPYPVHAGYMNGTAVFNGVGDAAAFARFACGARGGRLAKRTAAGPSRWINCTAACSSTATMDAAGAGVSDGLVSSLQRCTTCWPLRRYQVHSDRCSRRRASTGPVSTR